MKKQIQALFLSLSIIIMISFQACAQTSPDPIHYGHDQCTHCKMTIADARFGTILQTNKGRTCKFDDLQCMLDYATGSKVKKEDIAGFYLPDFNNQHALIPAKEMLLLKSDSLRSPMRGNIAAFETKADWEAYLKANHADAIKWEDLWN